MAKQLDVYRDWLGVTETARPLSHYQLLRLDPFEDRIAKIREHYRKLSAHVRKFSEGEHASQSRKLLGELARAMLCLTDVARKREYDASLGRQDAGQANCRSFEEVLLAGKLVDRGQLDKARSFAEATGLEVRDALLQQKMATPEAVALAYAESVGLPYVELAQIGVDPSLASQVPLSLARQHSCVPLMADAGQLLVASPNPLSPDVEQELRERFDMPVRTVLCTAAELGEAIARHCTGEAAAPPGRKKKKTARKARKAKPSPPAEADPIGRAEQLRRRGIVALMAFNVVVVLYVLWRFFFAAGSLAIGQFLGVAAFAIMLGALAGGLVFAVMHVLRL
jgi:hypothetical protein